MDAIYTLLKLTHIMLSAQLGMTFLKRIGDALLEWLERCRLRARLHDLSDGELRDIGITRGEVE